MPEARGDIREIVGQPVFVPLRKLSLVYGKVRRASMAAAQLHACTPHPTTPSAGSQVFRLSFGPKSFVVVSDAGVARHILFTNAANYSKGVLSEILDFVMGQGGGPLSMQLSRSTPPRLQAAEVQPGPRQA
jgi:beta-ring hydroxylase